MVMVVVPLCRLFITISRLGFYVSFRIIAIMKFYLVGKYTFSHNSQTHGQNTVHKIQTTVLFIWLEREPPSWLSNKNLFRSESHCVEKNVETL